MRCTRTGLERCHNLCPARPQPFGGRVIRCVASSPAFDGNGIESRREDSTIVRFSHKVLDLIQPPSQKSTPKSKESHNHNEWQWGDQSDNNQESFLAGQSWTVNDLALISAYITTRSHDGPSETDAGQEKLCIKRDERKPMNESHSVRAERDDLSLADPRPQ